MAAEPQNLAWQAAFTGLPLLPATDIGFSANFGAACFCLDSHRGEKWAQEGPKFAQDARGDGESWKVGTGFSAKPPGGKHLCTGHRSESTSRVALGRLKVRNLRVDRSDLQGLQLF